MTRRSLLVFPAAAWLPPSDFSRQLWTAIASIYTKTLVHPFLTGLQDGSLPRRKFQFYLLQDALYLGVFSRVLNVLASKAPRQEWAVSLGRDAIEAVDVERAMHRQILGSYGISQQQIADADMAPVNYAYTNHLMITAERGSFTEGLAAVLPCYWIYWEVGKELKKRGSRNRDYERWIDQYAGEDYAKTVGRVLEMMNAASTGLTADQQNRLKRVFMLSASYEYQFWDMAWREERWLP